MLSNAMGLILADNSRVHLGELSQPRALAAMLGARPIASSILCFPIWSIPGLSVSVSSP